MMHKLFSKISSPQKKKPQQFVIQNFVHLGNQLIQNATNPRKIPLLIETIRSIAEILIWSDQNKHEQFFNAFLEMKLLFHFESLLWIENTPTDGNVSLTTKGSVQSGSNYRKSLVNLTSDEHSEHETLSTLSETSSAGMTQFSVARQMLQKQLLQSLSIMIQNLSTNNSLYFILSNSVMNQFIKFRYDFHDEEVLDYYITFLKTISMVLDTSIIQFFFNEDEFLLYQEAKKYLTHKESMIRISVRTIILNIYSVPSPNIRAYIIKDSYSYLGKMVRFLRSELVQLNQMILDCRYTPLFSNIDSRISDFQDNLYYLNDLLELDIPEIQNTIQELFIQEFLNNFLLPSLEYEETDDDLLFGRQRDRILEKDFIFADIEERRLSFLVDGDAIQETISDVDQIDIDSVIDDTLTMSTSTDISDEELNEQSPNNYIDNINSLQIEKDQISNINNNNNKKKVNHTYETPKKKNISKDFDLKIEENDLNGKVKEIFKTPDKKLQNFNELASPISVFSPHKRSKRLTSEEYFIRKAIKDAIMYVEGRQHFESQDIDFTRDDIVQWHNQTKLIDCKLALMALSQLFLAFKNGNNHAKQVYESIESTLQNHEKSSSFIGIISRYLLSTNISNLSASASFLYTLLKQVSSSFLETWGIIPKKKEFENKNNLLLDMLSGDISLDNQGNSSVIPTTSAQKLSPQKDTTNKLISQELNTSVDIFKKSSLSRRSSSNLLLLNDSLELKNIVTCILQRLSHRHLVPKRILSIHILIQLCFELTKLSNHSISSAMYSRVRIKLNQEQLSLLENAVQIARRQVLKHAGNEIYDLFQLFESEHQTHIEIRNMIWERLCGDISIIIDDVTNQLPYYKREPTSATEEIRVNIHNFLALLHFYFIAVLDTSEILNTNLDKLIDSTSKYRIGMSIPLNNIEAIKVDVIVKKASDKNTIERQYIFADDSFLIVISSNLHSNVGTVLSVTPLRKIHMKLSKKGKAIYLGAFDEFKSLFFKMTIVVGQKRLEIQEYINIAIEKCLYRKTELLKKIIHLSPQDFVNE